MLLRLVIFGGIGGVLCDQIHVQLGVLWYPKPFLFGQAWWVAPLFGAATPAILLGAKAVRRRLERTVRVPDLVRIAYGFAWFLGAYFLTGLAGASSAALAAVFVVSWIARVFREPDPRTSIAFGLLLASGGVAFESLLSSTGAFFYYRPDLFGVPWWLFGLYLHGAPLALRMSARLGR
jgi:hypothetical protein